MNKIYKLKFNRQRQQLVVVSEISRGLSGSKNQSGIVCSDTTTILQRLYNRITPLSMVSFMILALLSGITVAGNLPSGANVVAGRAEIGVSGNTMTIQQGTSKLITDWNSFDIGQNHAVRFIQPASSAVALNRVTGVNPSQIKGTLSANGRVILVNPNGVLFGKDASVNSAGLVASTQNIRHQDFMTGNYQFSGGSRGNGQIINQGNLTTSKDGFVVLVGQKVSNQGQISTPGGKAVLVAADRVTLKLDDAGLTGVTVSGKVIDALVDNQGLISAADGKVYLTAYGKDMLLKTVVNNSGIVEAGGITSDGGVIRLDGGSSGVVSQSGKLLAASEHGKGGNIQIEGQNIHLADGSKTIATGGSAGGKVYAGGGWQGKDPSITNARKLVMSEQAEIDVSATDKGRGGTAVLWSEEYTNFLGEIRAQGGKAGGQGGQVETSSHHNLQVFGTVDVSAPQGKAGDWLLDPADVRIVSGSSAENVNVRTAAGLFSATDNDARVSVASIEEQLNKGGTVTIRTSGDNSASQLGNIYVDESIIKSKGPDAELILQSDYSIYLKRGARWNSYKEIKSTEGKLSLTLLAGDRNYIEWGSYFRADLNGGDFYAGPRAKTGGDIHFHVRNNGMISAGNITIDAHRRIDFYAFTMRALGNLTINARFTDISTGWGASSVFSAKDKLTLNATSGNLVISARDVASGASRIYLQGDNGVAINVNRGTLNLNTVSDPKKSLINITSNSGDVLMTASNGLAATTRNVNIKAANDVRLTVSASTATDGINLHSTNVTSDNGSILINSTTGSEGGNGVNLTSTNFTASEGGIVINGSAGNNGTIGALLTSVNFVAKDKIELIGNISIKQAANVTALDVRSSNMQTTGTDSVIILNGAPGSTNAGAGMNAVQLIDTTVSSAGTLNISGRSNQSKKGILINIVNSTLDSQSDMNITGNGAQTAVELSNSAIVSTAGNISVEGKTEGNFSGIRIIGDKDITASAGVIKMSAESKGFNSSTGEKGSLYITGRHTFTANKIQMEGYNKSSTAGGTGLVLDITESVFAGDTVIDGKSLHGAGISFWARRNKSSDLVFKNNATITGTLIRSSFAKVNSGVGGIIMDTVYSNNNVSIALEGGNLNITGDATSDKINPAGGIVFGVTSSKYDFANGLTFKGTGNIKVLGRSVKYAGVSSDFFNNKDFSGSLSIEGTSIDGDGVLVTNHGPTELVNASIVGVSRGANGISIISPNATASNRVSIKNSSVVGSTQSGKSGINIKANALDLEKGSMHGIVRSGKGNGVTITGMNNRIRDVSVNGSAGGTGAGLDLSNDLRVEGGKLAGSSMRSTRSVNVGVTTVVEASEWVESTGTVTPPADVDIPPVDPDESEIPAIDSPEVPAEEPPAAETPAAETPAAETPAEDEEPTDKPESEGTDPEAPADGGETEKPAGDKTTDDSKDDSKSDDDMIEVKPEDTEQPVAVLEESIAGINGILPDYLKSTSMTDSGTLQSRVGNLYRLLGKVLNIKIFMRNGETQDWSLYANKPEDLNEK